MAALKLIKFVALAILASSSAAEPTNRTCAGQDQDDMVALQVGEQSHAGGCKCNKVCPGYEKIGGGAHHFRCSDAKESFLASKPPGVDLEAFSRTKCEWLKGQWLIQNTKCWSHSGSALTVNFNLGLPGHHPCPLGFSWYARNPDSYCFIKYETSMNVVCPNGWCECRRGGCGCKAQGSCR
ncbi:unnamed protein product [Polarella glacialis]|uniref:Uncharacterized protein n=1 Tax=Polarella glacialis TaxID=89957 RepID=A0A813ISP5_POLGL|nr:unnamed protein product [Polarella glacialis]CAE8654287.1 unnamed protein product [Polarella glacialis]